MSDTSLIQIVVVDGADECHSCVASLQADVSKALLHGGFWVPAAELHLPDISMILSIKDDSAHGVVVRGPDFIAEFGVVSRNSSKIRFTLCDLLGHDPDDDWFQTVERRNAVAEILNGSIPPFALLVWKACSTDRLSKREFQALTKEVLRVIAGLSAELIERR